MGRPAASGSGVQEREAQVNQGSPLLARDVEPGAQSPAESRRDIDLDEILQIESRILGVGLSRPIDGRGLRLPLLAIQSKADAEIERGLDSFVSSWPSRHFN